MKAKDLKNSILQMAVEGKLVPQDPNDEPASALLERIREEKHKLIAEGKAKYPKGGESIIYIGSDGSPYEKRVDAKGRVLSEKCIADEVPFGELPEGWAWARLESLCSVITDGDHQAPPQQSSGVPFLVISNVSSGKLDFSATRYVSAGYYESLDSSRKPIAGDLLLTVTGSYGIPVPVDTNTPFCFQRHIALLRPLGCRPFLNIVIAAPPTYEYFKYIATGTAQKTVSLSSLRSTLFPIPPLAEQHRIVERVNELMPLVKEYGELEDAREALDAALPGRLRKSVLQTAVQGKLASQDSSDEPASTLLQHIREQRRQLIAEKKMKAPKGGESVIFTGSDGRRYEKRVDAKGRESEPVCIEDEIPFEIPDSWEWARLESIGTLLRGSGIKRSEVVSEGKPCVRYGELYTTYDGVIEQVSSRVDNNVFGASKKLDPGEVLVALTGENNVDIGRAVHNASGEILAYGGDLLAVKNHCMLGEYLALAINSPAVAPQRSRAATGNIIVHLSTAKVAAFLIPVPPMAEQRRIAACLSKGKALVTNQ